MHRLSLRYNLNLLMLMNINYHIDRYYTSVFHNLEANKRNKCAYNIKSLKIKAAGGIEQISMSTLQIIMENLQWMLRYGSLPQALRTI